MGRRFHFAPGLGVLVTLMSWNRREPVTAAK